MTGECSRQTVSQEKSFLVLLLLASFAFVIPLSSPVFSAGGSRTSAPSAYATVINGNTGATASIPNVIQNDYVLVVVGFVGTGQTVSNGGVTDSAGTSYTKVVSSNVREDVEVWCGQYVAATGSVTVTVAATGAASYSFRAILVAGITSCTADAVRSNSGVARAASVASFTPTTGDFCEAAASVLTGSAATWTSADPFLTVQNGGAPLSKLTSGTNYVVDEFRGSWNSNDGATTATITPSASSSPQWDEVVACLPTSSGGNEIYVANFRGMFTRASSNNPSLATNGILKNDYVVAVIALSGTGVTVTSVTDNLGPFGTVYSKVASSNVRDDVEIWIGQATATGSGGAGPQVTFHLSGNAPAAIGATDIAGITSTTAQVFTNSGTAATVSIGSSTPNSRDLCVAAASVHSGQAGTTFTVPANQPFQPVTTSTDLGSNTYAAVTVRADWPASLSTTATITPSGTTSPTWDEVVACFPGTVVVPLTCTMDNSAPAATLALSESSGNSLSPSSVACDGGSHNITVDPSITLTATEPADVANSRDRFSGGGTTTTDGTCAGSASGLCSAWSFTNYNELRNTYQATPTNPATWDAALSVPVTGTLAGSSGQTVCTISTSNGGGAASCLGFADYNRLVTVASPIAVSGTEQWAQSGGNTFTDTTGGNTHNVNYVDQFQVSFRVVPGGAGTTNPSGSNVWMNFGADSISATANAGSAFSVWSSTGSIVIASPSSASTSAGVSGTGTITAWFTTLVSDSSVFSDSPSTVLLLSRAAPDTSAFSETVSRIVALPRAAADAFGFADSLVTGLSLTRVPSDTFSVLQGVLVNVLASRGAADSFAYFDSLGRQLAIGRNLAELFPFSDSMTTSLLLPRVSADSFIFADAASRLSQFARGLQDTFPFLDSAITSSNLARGISDSVSFTDAAGRLLSIPRSLLDLFGFGDVASHQLSLSQSVGDAFDFSDLPGRLVSVGRAAGDALPFADLASQTSALARSADDQFLTAENAIRSLALSGLVSDPFAFAENVGAGLNFLRNTADSALFADLPSATSGIFRAAQDIFTTTDNAARLLQRMVHVFDVFSFSDHIGGSRHIPARIFEFVNDGFQFLDQAARTVGLPRAIIDTTYWTDAAARSLDLLRSLSAQFPFGEIASRSASLFVAVEDALRALENAISSVVQGTTSTQSTSTGGGNPSETNLMVFVLPMIFLLLLALLVLLAYIRKKRKERG